MPILRGYTIRTIGLCSVDPTVERLFRSSLQALLYSSHTPQGASVDVVFRSAQQMRYLYDASAGRNKATDFLAFPARFLELDGSLLDVDSSDVHLGEIHVCFPHIERKLGLRRYRHADADTFVLLGLIHAFLHLKGFTHDDDDDHAEMRVQERKLCRILQKLMRRGDIDRVLCGRLAHVPAIR
jgi:rRNA maturation RNase YbeY